MKSKLELRRLFVPLNTEPFEWFKSGSKRWELRSAERQFAPERLIWGRRVELRKGYSGEPLWGVIGRQYAAASLGKIFARVNVRKIVPTATNVAEAKRLARKLLGKRKRYVVFEVLL